MTRKITFAQNEYYHIFNRGVDKRSIYMIKNDIVRFWYGMVAFNSVELTESLTLKIIDNKKVGIKEFQLSSEPLVRFVAYCLNENHYHFILTPVVDRGIQKFMHRLGLGYSSYINERCERSGSLFQGPYKAVHISTNEQLLHTSVYVNLNDRVHERNSKDFTFRDLVSQTGISRSSWLEYISNKPGICDYNIVLSQFKDAREYEKFALDSFEDICTRKDMEKLRIEEQKE